VIRLPLRRWWRAAEGTAPRRRLFGKYMLICASLVGAALLVSGLVQFWFTYQQTSSGQGRLEREQAATAAATILQFFGQIEPELRLVNQSVQAAGSPQAGTGDQRRAQYEILITRSPPITTLHYVDQFGQERLAVSRLAATAVDSGADFSQDASFIQARRTRTTAYGPVEFHDASEPYLTMAVPERGAAAGVLLAEVNLKFVGDVISHLTTGQAGYAYVVDGQRRLIAHHDVSLVLQNHDLSQLPQVQATHAAGEPGTQPALLGAGQGDTAIIGRDLQGHRVLSAHQHIDPPGWVVFVDQPLSEAYAPVYSSIIRTATLLIAGLALAVLASFTLARRMVAPIRALQAGAARIGAGDLDLQIELRTGDELEALGDAFNNMAVRLRESYALWNPKWRSGRASSARP
jgi:HAMP domain-containing protein